MRLEKDVRTRCDKRLVRFTITSLEFYERLLREEKGESEMLMLIFRRWL